MAVFGESSGGNYAAMACVAADAPLFDDPALGDLAIPCAVQAAIDWYGPIDFSSMDAQLTASGLGLMEHDRPESMEEHYLGGRL